ncbi:MAG: hypothetical protein BWY95_01477 [Bacteroidetes bacterium ADurb.BinA104]|nr:MAG: hypothetical protein BWY95_01477 [Bacteroidetes bacterium ADurb.BinA104]
MVAYPVDNLLIGSNETADGRQRFAECAHDYLYLVGDSEMAAYATSAVTHNSQSVSLVNHYAAVVLLLQSSDPRQVGQIAFHTEDSINHNQLERIRLTTFQVFFKRLHIIVTEFHRLGK